MIEQENAEDFEEFNYKDVLEEEEEELFHNVPVLIINVEWF